MGGLVGDRALIARMREMISAVTGPEADKLVRGALVPLKEQTEVNAKTHRQPGKTPKGGHLDQGVMVKLVDKKRTRRVGWVSFGKRARHIAHLVEFGTRPHLQPRRGIMHPGARPFPFFRPAYDAKKTVVLKRLAELTWALVRSKAAKAPNRSRK